MKRLLRVPDTLELLNPEETICLPVSELLKLRNAPPLGELYAEDQPGDDRDPACAETRTDSPTDEDTPAAGGWIASRELWGDHSMVLELPRLTADSFNLSIDFDAGELGDAFREAGSERREYPLYSNLSSGILSIRDIPMAVALVEEGMQWSLLAWMRPDVARPGVERTTLRLGSRLTKFSLEIARSPENGHMRCRLLQTGLIGHIPVYPGEVYYGSCRLGIHPSDAEGALWPEAKWEVTIRGTIEE